MVLLADWLAGMSDQPFRGWYKQWTWRPGTGGPRTHRDPLSQYSIAYVTVFIPNVLCITVITSKHKDRPFQGAYPIISACAEDNLEGYSCTHALKT